jgi:hypothetical protein
VVNEVDVLDGLPANANIYDSEGLGPCWCVFVPWGDGLDRRKKVTKVFGARTQFGKLINQS